MNKYIDGGVYQYRNYLYHHHHRHYHPPTPPLTQLIRDIAITTTNHLLTSPPPPYLHHHPHPHHPPHTVNERHSPWNPYHGDGRSVVIFHPPHRVHLHLLLFQVSHVFARESARVSIYRIVTQ